MELSVQASSPDAEPLAALVLHSTLHDDAVVLYVVPSALRRLMRDGIFGEARRFPLELSAVGLPGIESQALCCPA